jgi:hypothetical protein
MRTCARPRCPRTFFFERCVPERCVPTLESYTQKPGCPSMPCGPPGKPKLSSFNPTHGPHQVRPASGIYSPNLVHPNIMSDTLFKG